jgi:hypothetical protein
MVTLQPVVRRFGSPGPGIEVLERSGGSNALVTPLFGTAAVFAVLKRGPMGVAIPITSRNQYHDIFGDPRDSSWHLFRDSSHLGPDAIEGFFGNNLGAGTLWVTRLDLDGTARKAEILIKGRNGANVLKIHAANEGRWGGEGNQIESTPIVHATSRTFTLIAPGVMPNEFAGGFAEFSSIPGKKYKIVANTSADTESGEVIFTVLGQFSLIDDGVAGFASLPGLASYSPTVDLTGSISFSLLKNVLGTVNINGRVLIGTETNFVNDLSVGNNIYYGGEVRIIDSITSQTTLTVSAAFTGNATGTTIQTDNLEIVGTGTNFTNDLVIGDLVSVTIDGVTEIRVVQSIESATSLKVNSGFSSAIAVGTILKKGNKIIRVAAQDVSDTIQPGDFIVDPNRSGFAIKVIEVNYDAPNSFVTIEEVLPVGFASAQLVKQSQKARVYLEQTLKTGLSVEFGQGVRFPDTHFSMVVKFNGNQVVIVDDASLDPTDPLFIEPLINDSNVAYRSGLQNFQKWVTVEALWMYSQDTFPGNDVRPCNGSGEILLIHGSRLYTVADIDYSGVVNNFLFPNPYISPRNSLRVIGSVAPKQLTGTISSNGTNVTGISTSFLTEVVPGDYLYDPNTNSVRRVIRVTTNNLLVLEQPFSLNIPIGTTGKIAGNLQIDMGYNLSEISQGSQHFFVTYPQYLTRGYDGDTANIMPHHFTRYADPDRNFLENAVFGKNMGLIRMFVPGISDISVQKAFAAYAEAKAYEFRGEIPSSYNTAMSAEFFINQMVGRSDFVTYAFPSYGFISNQFGSGYRYIPINGDIIGGESYRSVVAEGYHRPFAGVDARLPRILHLPFELTASDEGLLNRSGIQPIKSFSGSAVVFGARSPSSTTMYDFTHIRRIQSNYVRVFLEARTLLEMMFSPTQPSLVQKIIMILNDFARREYDKGVFTQFLNFGESAATVSAGALDGGGSVLAPTGDSRSALIEVINGRLSIFFSYVPTGILEKLSINCGPDMLVASYASTGNNA